MFQSEASVHRRIVILQHWYVPHGINPGKSKRYPVQLDGGCNVLHSVYNALPFNCSLPCAGNGEYEICVQSVIYNSKIWSVIVIICIEI